MYASYNVHPADHEIARHFGDWDQNLQFGITDTDAFNKKLLPMVDEGLKTLPLYAGAQDVLQALQDKPVALLSASTHRILDPALERLELTKFFDVIVTGEDVTAHKPDPEGIFKALDALGGKPDGAIMVGDSRKDLGAAQNAGIDSLLMYPPEHKVFYDLDELKQYKPTHIAKNFKEAKQILVT